MFTLDEIVTQKSALGFLFPQKETALIFGGDSNSAQTKENLLKWTQAVLDSVLPDYFKGTPYAPQVKRSP